MTASAAAGATDRAEVLACLAHQRAAVLDVLADLDEADLRRSVVPSAWTPLGLVEHLGYAERLWGQRVLAGEVADLPWPRDDARADSPWDGNGHEVADVLAFYRDQCERTDAVLAGLDLGAVPTHVPRADLPTDLGTVREVVLHLVEETARHAGHLDIARELLDGRTGLGPR